MIDKHLQHWGLSSGDKKDGSKYIERITVGVDPKTGRNKYRYFYTKSELEAYKLENGLTSNLSGLSKMFSNIENVLSTKVTEISNMAYGLIEQYLPYRPETKTEVQPEKDPYDNTYTDKQIQDNLQNGIYKDIVKQLDWANPNDTPEQREEKLRKYGKRPNETESQFYERMGVIDETAPGMHPASFSDLKLKDEEFTHKEEVAVVNQNNLKQGGNEYGSPEEYGYSNNCAYCTAAYDLRARGYDVEASSVSTATCNELDTIASWYEDGEFKPFDGKTWVQVEQQLRDDSTNGNARGQFCVYWKVGGGHSMTYEVRNGKTYIIDGQTNKEMTYYDWVRENSWKVSAGANMRTDNKEPTDKILVTVKNRNTDGPRNKNRKKKAA